MVSTVYCRGGHSINFEYDEEAPNNIPLLTDENGNKLCISCYAKTRKVKKDEIKEIIKEMKSNGEI